LKNPTKADDFAAVSIIPGQLESAKSRPKVTAELEYYKEQLEHGRHIEVQRSTVAGLAIAMSGAIVGELLKKPLTREQLPYTVTLCFVNLVALLIIAKLYERFRMHNETAKLVRNKIDPSLAAFRLQAQETMRTKYPFLFKLRLHVIWNCLFGGLSVLGIVTTLVAYCRR
jgi:hypothetical protein